MRKEGGRGIAKKEGEGGGGCSGGSPERRKQGARWGGHGSLAGDGG